MKLMKQPLRLSSCEVLGANRISQTLPSSQSSLGGVYPIQAQLLGPIHLSLKAQLPPPGQYAGFKGDWNP